MMFVLKGDHEDKLFLPAGRTLRHCCWEKNVNYIQFFPLSNTTINLLTMLIKNENTGSAKKRT